MKKSTKVLITACFWLIVWQLVSAAFGRQFILPSPLTAFKTLCALFCTKAFWIACGVSLFRVVLGLVISLGLGFLGAYGAYRSAFVRMVLGGPVAVLKATPVMSVILFFILCLSSGNVPVFVCFMMCFPVIYTNILQGFDSLPREYSELASVYRIGGGKFFNKILMPWTKPYLKAGLSLCSGLAWKTTVAAEVLSAPRISMGYHLLVSKSYLEGDKLFAWTIAIVGLSVIFEKCVKKVLTWI